MSHVPLATVKGVYLGLDMFSFQENAKYGEMGRWPSTHQFQAHYPSFLEKGYESHRECIDIRFEMSTVEPDKGLYVIKPFSVGYIDGQNKALIMLSMLAIVHELAPCFCIKPLSFGDVLFSVFGLRGFYYLNP